MYRRLSQNVLSQPTGLIAVPPSALGASMLWVRRVADGGEEVATLEPKPQFILYSVVRSRCYLGEQAGWRALRDATPSLSVVLFAYCLTMWGRYGLCRSDKQRQYVPASNENKLNRGNMLYMNLDLRPTSK